MAGSSSTVQMHDFCLVCAEVHLALQVVNYFVRKCKRCHLVQILLCYLEMSEMLNKLTCSPCFVSLLQCLCALCIFPRFMVLVYFWKCFRWIISSCKTNQSNKLWLEQHGCGLMNSAYRRRRKCDLGSIDVLIWSDLPAFLVTLLKVDFIVWLVWVGFSSVSSWGEKTKCKALQEIKLALQYSICLMYCHTRTSNTCVNVYKTV